MWDCDTACGEHNIYNSPVSTAAEGYSQWHQVGKTAVTHHWIGDERQVDGSSVQTPTGALCLSHHLSSLCLDQKLGPSRTVDQLLACPCPETASLALLIVLTTRAMGEKADPKLLLQDWPCNGQLMYVLCVMPASTTENHSPHRFLHKATPDKSGTVTVVFSYYLHRHKLRAA